MALHLVRPELVQAEPARPKLIVDGVSKRFLSKRARVEALDNVSLAVAEGEFVCLIGASGCGKSTLLDIMAGLTRPDRGRAMGDAARAKARAEFPLSLCVERTEEYLLSVRKAPRSCSSGTTRSMNSSRPCGVTCGTRM